jgi:hypothetical protein
VLARQALYHVSHSANLFALLIFKMGSHFMTWLAWTIMLLFVLPHVAGRTGVHHHAQPLIEMGVSQTFCLD